MVLGQIGNENILLRPLEAGDVSETKGIKLPVFFRHPGVKPPPGDSILRPKPGPAVTP